MADETTGSLVDFRLPSLGSDMDSGTILRWRVAVGDEVKKGSVLVDVDTEKAEVEVEVWQDATIAELVAEPGAEVPVGTTIARLRVGEPAVAHANPARGPSPRSSPPATPRSRSAELASPSASPFLSGEHVTSSAVTPRTVYWPRPQHVGTTPPSLEASVSDTPTGSRSDRMRLAIAKQMARSNTEIPHYHLVSEVDITAAMSFLETINETRSAAERILPAALFMTAIGRSAMEHPELNGHWVDGHFRPAAEVALAVAVHLRAGGLVAPVLGPREKWAVADVMADLAGAVNRARSGLLRAGDLAPASMTVTNVGVRGADQVLGVIHAPQVALVGIGRPRKVPLIDGDGFRPGEVISLSLAADHRASDGHAGSRFLASIEQYLSNPEDLQ